MESNDLSYEPMDIDLSTQSVKEMDISYDHSDTDIKETSTRVSRNNISAGTVTVTDELPSRRSTPSIQSRVKKYHIMKRTPPRRFKNRLFKIAAAVVIVFVAIIAYYVHSMACCEQLNIKLLNETMTAKLFGQSAAVADLIQSLDLEAKSKLIFFSGGTGVGKTYTSFLLLDSLGSYSNIYHYTMPSFKRTFSTDFMFGLVLCEMSLIIVDDLTINDMDIKIHIQELIDKTENLGNKITVILIYNCNEDRKGFDSGCDESFERRLLNNFADIKAVQRFIKFEPLSERHLIECINQELPHRQISNMELRELLKNFNVTVDGCKGVHSKMKYLNIV